MRTFEEVNKIMLLLPKEWRDHWCTQQICACIGGVNCSARSIYTEKSVEPITREEWEMWKRDGEENMPPMYYAKKYLEEMEEMERHPELAWKITSSITYSDEDGAIILSTLFDRAK